MLFTQVWKGDVLMTEIYDKNRMKCRTNIQQMNTLFEMGKELEGKVDSSPVSNFDVEFFDDYLQLTITGGITVTDKTTYTEIIY